MVDGRVGGNIYGEESKGGFGVISNYECVVTIKRTKHHTLWGIKERHK